MAERLSRGSRGLTWVALALLLTTFLTPIAALADTNLEVGGEAVVAYANGDDVRLRDDFGYDGKVVRMVYEGAAVDVLDGPLEDSDGNLWYQVKFDGDVGYIVSDYLALQSGPNASSADAAVNPAGDAIGTALISGTNNDGVRCRADADPGAAVITVVPEGTTVEITGAQVGDWQPINCGGQGGYVSTTYVDYDMSGSDTSSDDAVDSASVGGEAVVSGTNGDGVRCRSGASYDSNIITTLSEGSSVTLRDVVKGDFQGVVCAGENGYAASIYLSDGSGSSSSDSGSDEVTGTATVSGTNGDGVRCRADAGLDGSIIVVLSEGTDVSLRDASSGDWQGVVCGGTNGFIASEFLDYGGGSSSDSSDATGSGVISGTNGDGVRCRASESFNADVLSVLSEGESVDIRGDQDGDWVPVVCAGSNGWIFADYINGSGSGSSSDGSSGGSSNSSLESGDVAVVDGTNGDGVRLRSAPSTDSAVVMVLTEGTTVNVIDGSSGDWVAVSVSGTSGYVHMDLPFGRGRSELERRLELEQ